MRVPFTVTNPLCFPIRALTLVSLPCLLIPIEARADSDPMTTIIVTADRIPLPLALTGSSVSVITSNDLAQQQINTISDALRQEPGVEADRTGGVGGTTSVMLRGFDGKNVKILIDGIDVADPSATASQYDFADLLAGDTARIEIVRGPQSTLYGSDAMGGIINIVTKSGRTDPGGSVTLEGGSYGTVDGNAAVRGMAGDLDYAATIAGLHTDGIIAADQKNGNQQHDPYNNITATLKLGLPVTDWLDLSTVFRYVDANLVYPGYSYVTELPADNPGQLQTTEEFYARAQASLHLFDGKLLNVLGFNVSEIDRNYLFDSVQQSYYHGKTNQVDDQATVTVTDWLTAVAGGESKAEYYADNTGLGAEQRIDGLYAELEAQPIQPLVLTGGVRYDSVEGGADATTYRFTASYQPFADGPRLHASDGTGFKAPSLYQLFVSSPYVEGDRNLRPESSSGWDTGLEQALPIAHSLIDVTYFYNDIRDLIDGYTDANYVYHYDNVGHARTYGLEASLSAQPIDTLDLKAAYTWLRTEDLTNGGELLRRPHNTLSGTATWRPVQDISSFATVTWVDARFDDDFQPGAPPLARLSPYTLVSFGGAWQATDIVSVFARVENALDRRYEEVFGYGTPGRAAYAGVTAKF